ncbi:MAG TPA: 5-(carboxyamino)imidazole ribonucleotide mutase [Chloroflexota bacterium]|nr:5-(carboxyamino)imidazole ribonucleotide mutase [Chloroflexota bacterium]
MAVDRSGAAVVGVVMGSDSDLKVMGAAAEALAEFGVPAEVRVVSAHRTPQAMLDYGRTAAARGLKVIIAGAGGAAHLPGMLASVTPLPVIGVPVPLTYLDGLDSLLSIVQMPAGVPVATVAVAGARNAGLLAVRILAAADPALRQAMERFQAQLTEVVAQKDAAVRAAYPSPGQEGGTTTAGEASTDR